MRSRSRSRTRSPDRGSMKSAMSISPVRSESLHSPKKSASSAALGAPTVKNDNIKVIARFRPDNTDENVVEYSPDGQSVNVLIDGRYQDYIYDRVFDDGSEQQQLFDYSVRQTTDDLAEGYNGTVLCYGQTGAGKSYTVMGELDEDENKGLVPRIFERIFEIIEQSPRTLEYTLGVSYMEIYNEKLRDLLDPGNNGKLAIHENRVDGVYVSNLETFYVADLTDVYTILKQGSVNRTTGSTRMNRTSSRSHAIFQINLASKDLETGIVKTGKLFLVDLAGSEKIDKTGATGQLLEEAKKINSSLSALGNVINCLTDSESSHIPYRDSKLTRILQESLGGNSRTTLIINCSPTAYNAQETVSTLRFGARAKHIKNAVHINSELSTNELKKRYLEQVQVNEQNVKRIETMEMRIHVLEEENQALKQQIQNGVSAAEFRDALRSGDGNDNAKVATLEKALEQFDAQIGQVDLQNNDLRQDIISLQEISQMKDARIDELQRQLNSREALVQMDSDNFENKMIYLKDRLNAAKAPMTSNTSSLSAMFQSENKENGARKKAKSAKPSSAAASAASKRMGLNLRIVKPMRGGGGGN